jgi:hypothetical protein
VADIKVLQPQVHLAVVMEELIILIKQLMERITQAAAAAAAQEAVCLQAGTVELEVLVW